jgi:Cu+-exporting ATPase
MDQPLFPARSFELSIGGMTCASCVARIEKSLGRVPGVQHVAVNLATETAHIETGAGTKLPDLISSVVRAGYTAADRRDAIPGSSSRELIELIIAALLSAPLMLSMFLPRPAWVALAFATPVQFWLGARFYVAGYKALRAGSGNMDLLVALGTSAAYFLSLADFLLHSGPLYFEASAAVITLIRLGKYLEGRAKREAAQAVTGLANLRPAFAHRIGGADVPLAKIAVGDAIEVRAGERVPVDGTITTGAGYLDESHITGESMPVLRASGAKILAGTLNLDSVLRITVSSQPGETFLDRMARLIEAAQASKPDIQRLADRVSAVFVPVVLAIALITFAGWMLAGAPVATAIINAVSVLVIACPCALGLATPAAILAGTGAAAKHGILIRNADALEHGSAVNFVVFDKTGTLTEGKPRLIELKILADMPRETVLDYAAALAASDTHPLSTALRKPNHLPAINLRALPGRGVEGTVAGIRLILGSAALIADAGGLVPPLTVPPQTTLSYLAKADGTVLAAFAFADTARADSKTTIARLKSLGCKVALLSGDREAAAKSVGQDLGITEIIAEASPEQKIATIKAKRAAGYVVAMVGDGINDAASLAAADVGIAIGSGADVTIEAADFSLLRPNTALVADALELSRRAWSTLKQGLFWAMIYNLVGIPLAAFGVLSPTIAGAAMAASSVSVLANALRLRNWGQNLRKVA